MKNSEKIKILFDKGNVLDFLKLAKSVGNEKLYLSLVKREKNDKELSEILNLHEEYQLHLQEFNKPNYDQNEILANYERFLTEKICFPNRQIDDSIIEDIINRNTWFYHFFIFPKKSLDSINLLFDVGEKEYGLFKYEVFWLQKFTKVNLFDDFKKILPLSRTWSESEEAILYGQYHTNRLIIFHETEIIKDVSLILDLTSYESILKRVVEYCRSKNLLFMDKKYNVLPLDFKVINNVIKNSEEFLNYQKSLRN